MKKITKIFFNGQIVTMDRKNTIVEAVALSENKIFQVGTNEKILSLKGPNTVCIDLKGKTMLPGLYECHGHFQLASNGENNKVDLAAAPLGEMETIDQCIEALKRQRDSTPDDMPVYGWRFDNTGMEDNRHLYREDLDKVSIDRPVIVNHISHHLVYLNSKALELFGITKDTDNPPGGVIQKDVKTGEPNGILEETAQKITEKSSKMIMDIDYPNEDARFEDWKKMSLKYASLGVTTANDAVCYLGHALQYQKATEKGYFKIRLTINPVFTDYEKVIQSCQNNPYFTVGGAKLFQDGSIQGYTAYLKEPFHIQPPGKNDYCGYSVYSKEQLKAFVFDAQEKGWQVVVHNCGDAGLEEFISAVEHAEQVFGKKDLRHVALHCIVVQEQQLDRIVKLDMIASFFVDHVFFWGDKHREKFLGEQRTEYLCPMNSAIKKGIVSNMHCDNPAGPELPFLSMWSAIVRKTRNGEVIGDSERISVMDALRSFTIDAAYQFYEENTKGSIEPEKYADLIIIDKDILRIPVDQIKDIEVLETYVDGELVFKK